jgi:DNA-binding LacI/PurR family transcriptional regulator
MKVTIKDIAKEAGVSYQTVSKALRGTGVVNPSTAERIKRIAREKGYVPSLAARAMATQKSQLVAVFLPQIASSFYNKILQGIEHLAIANDYGILLYLFENTNIEEKLETILSYQVDGIVIFENHFSLQSLNKFKSRNIPLLFVNSTDIPQEASHIAIDTFYGLKLSFEHLTSLGHRKILLALSDHELGMKRVEEIKRTIPAEYSVKLISKVYCDNYSSREVFKNFSPQDLPDGVTAIVCTSDYIALPIITRLQEHGFAIPGDVSVVGFDDLEFAEFLNPPLTTVEQPKREFGEKIFQTMLELMQNETNQHLTIFPKLIVRGTTKRIDY